MKWIALPFLLLAMVGASAQQIGPAVASDTTGLRIDPDAKIQLRADPNLSFQSASSIIAPGSEDVCYTMHVIQFEARDGDPAQGWRDDVYAREIATEASETRAAGPTCSGELNRGALRRAQVNWARDG